MLIEFNCDGHIERIPAHLETKFSAFQWKTIKTSDSGIHVFGHLNNNWWTLKAIKKAVLAKQQTKHQRFLTHIDLKLNTSECWIWTGCCSTSGYPMIRIGHKSEYARLHFFEGIGKSQIKLKSTCGNKRCMRPQHFIEKEVLDARPKIKIMQQPHAGRT